MILGDAGAAGTKPAALPSETQPALTLLSLNEATAATVSFMVSALKETDGVRIGRAPGGAVVLKDPRTSLIHFAIRLKAEDGVAAPSAKLRMELTDESSNGTWVNDKLMGKGNSVQLETGDRIFILPSAKVGQQEMIGFAAVIAGQSAPERQMPIRPPPTPCTAASGRGRDLGKDFVQSVHCKICGEAPIHRCITAVPCGHNFCLGCFLVWRQKSHSCPQCQEPVKQAVRNHSMDGVINTFLEAHPESARPATNLQILDVLEKDRKYAAGLDRLLSGLPCPEPSSRRGPPALPLDHLSNASDSLRRQALAAAEGPAAAAGAGPVASTPRRGSAACVVS